MNRKWILTAALVLCQRATSLQLPSLTTKSCEISRRSAVATLVTSSSATVASTRASATPSSRLVSTSGGDIVERITLSSKNKKAFPLASFGLQIYDDETAYRLTLMALEVGYRNFFASVLAGNQKGFAKVSNRRQIYFENFCI